MFFLSGHATLIGEKTGKCINYSVMCKSCRICDTAKGGKPKDHQCSKNWSGSAKSMEPAMACEMLKDIQTKGKKVQNHID